jgi:predicted RNase H-like nuclease (RuvC/YqgF family)
MVNNTEDGEEKRGRGRPTGSLNKSNIEPAKQENVQDLKNEIAELQNTVNSLKDTIEGIQGKVTVSAPTVSVDQPDNQRRLTVLQAWVEMFHHFLNTGRITNSVDKSAEAALEELMLRLPENEPIADYQPLSEGVTPERYYSIQHGGDAT